MANRLLDRQRSLLEYLTSGAAVFGDGDLRAGHALSGIDQRLLGLEARFSYEKRLKKIVTIFPRTFDMIGGTDTAILREFVNSCPPTSISRLDNARQFYAFINAHWEREPPNPPYLPDVAACELACAEARIHADAPLLGQAGRQREPRRGGMRRAVGAALLRCRFDVRPIFEQASPGIDPVQRDTLVAVAMPAGADEPRVFELNPAIFELLESLDDWTDAEGFAARPHLQELITDLAEHGLIEVDW